MWGKKNIFLTQMVWFRENWYEEVLRQLKQGLAKCHAVAFENRGAGENSSLDEAGVFFMLIKRECSDLIHYFQRRT